MRRVLFIAYLYPPIANSGTRRSLSFFNHLPDHGWEPNVLTVANPAERLRDDTLLDEIRPGTAVERVPTASAAISRRLAAWLTPAPRQAAAAAGLEWRIDRLLQAPDDVVSWYPPAVRHGVALHRHQPFDVIYASGWPWTAFLVARAIGLKTGCPYVLDYRDTWRPSGTHEWEVQTRLQALVNPWLERRAARHAAAVVTVTPSLVKVIGSDAGKTLVHCITNGFEPADFSAPAAALAADDGLIHISYTGVWRPGYGLEDLYRAIQRLKQQGSTPALQRLRVSAAGFKPGPARAMGVDDVVQELGPVPHARALHLMQRADALYLPVPLGYYAKASLPGKLFEYLGSGRPILAVVPPDSDVAGVVQAVGGALRLDPGDIAGLADALASLCQGSAAGLFSARRPEQLKRYTRAETTRELAAVFEQARARA